MATLYVTEPGVQVTKQGERLLVRRDKDILQDIPLIKVDRLVLMGRGVSISTPAMYALVHSKADILYLTSSGGFISRVVGQEHKHSRLRQAQAIAVTNPELALKIARAIVDGKINNQRVLVQRHAEGAAWAQSALARMDSMRKQTVKVVGLDELRGHEGMAAKDYFGLMRQMIKPPLDGKSWGFERREYYPPPDPFNALLSFGYTLLLNDLIAACQLAGLDPYLGFFHAIDYGKPAMALDLEEEFRPVIVDSIVLTAVNRSIFRLNDFEHGKNRSPSANANPQKEQKSSVRPIFMTESARKRFISLYETRINEKIHYPLAGEQTTYRRIFQLQAHQMAKLILGETEHYAPLMVR
jgi:CRISPR-associated protein Cas1